jgi:hypothetical protein
VGEEQRVVFTEVAGGAVEIVLRGHANNAEAEDEAECPADESGAGATRWWKGAACGDSDGRELRHGLLV